MGNAAVNPVERPKKDDDGDDTVILKGEPMRSFIMCKHLKYNIESIVTVSNYFVSNSLL
jgi:hypothetical protein